jgi:toluene monooxygenase system protein E
MADMEVLKPLKTWSHLAQRRRRPSEYEIVSTNLHYHTKNPNAPWELDPNIFMNQWYRKYREGCQLKHDNWDSFRDPDEVVYRTYNIMQDGQETYVLELFNQFSDREHDKGLAKGWVENLLKLYTPSRYLFHTLQMASHYVSQMAPASTITNCCSFQAADMLRWVSHTAYRTKELATTYPALGFGSAEQKTWENDKAWQGFRELMEKVLIAWDWGEAFTALNLVAKPAAEEAVLRRLGESAKRNGDTLLGLLVDAQLIDSARHRRWAGALVKMALEKDGNSKVLRGWVAKWEPLANAAVKAYCVALPDVEDAEKSCMTATREFRAGLGI